MLHYGLLKRGDALIVFFGVRGMRYSKLVRYMPAIKIAAVTVAIATTRAIALASGDPQIPPSHSAY